MVNATLAVAAAISTEAALSFLGLRRAAAAELVGPHARRRRAVHQLDVDSSTSCSSPGFMLLLTVLAVNFLGDALRDAFDPQSRH